MRLLELVLPLSASAISVGLLVWWLAVPSDGTVVLRLSGADAVPVTPVDAMSTILTKANQPQRGDGQPSPQTGQWIGFRGNHRDAISDDDRPLARDWPVEGPPVLWSINLGEGYASPVVQGGCAYVLDYDEASAADTLRCLSLDDGREVWRNSYPVQLTRNHGLSRTVPVIVDDCVITFGPRCHVACWDTETGSCHWLIDLVQDFAAVVPRWYAGQCPLVDQGRLILAPCGDAMLIAVDYQTGEVLWESPNPRHWEMTHASVMPMEFAGQRSYLYCGSGGVAAVAAEDGRLLWDSTLWPTTFATCPSPLVLPEGRIFLCSGYGRTVGSLMLKVQLTGDPATGDQLTAEPLFQLTPKQFNSEHHTPIFYGNHIYGVRKSGGGQLVCLDLHGNEVWNSGRDRFGHGPYIIADGRLFVMDDHGVLTMAEATPTGYQRLARSEVFPDGHDAWGPMAIADGRLIVRDMTRMTCLDLSQK